MNLVPKPDKYFTKEIIDQYLLGIYKCKIFNKILANQIQKHIERIIHHDQGGLIPRMQGWLNLTKPIKVTHYINRMKEEKADDAEKAMDKSHIHSS